MPPKHRQVTINNVSRHAQFCAKSMPLEAADEAGRGASLMIRLRVDDDFHNFRNLPFIEERASLSSASGPYPTKTDGPPALPLHSTPFK
jgi:hypothetical protein